MKEWYAHFNGREQGPLDLAQLRSMLQNGKMTSEDLVWTDGMTDWAPAGSVTELKPANQPIDSSEVIPTLPLSIDDPGPFRKIGKTFRVNSLDWEGPIVASPSGFYLLKIRRTSSGYGGGAIGFLLATALARDDDATRTCDLHDLAPRVRAQLDRKGKRAGGDVIVIRKGAVSFVRVGRINNVVDLRLGQERIRLNIGLFRNGGVRRFLRENGWTLGQEMQPTEAPIHGVDFGRDPLAPRPKGRHPAIRILYFILGVLLIIAIIWVRFVADGRHQR